jgi:hypothetical protein
MIDDRTSRLLGAGLRIRKHVFTLIDGRTPSLLLVSHERGPGIAMYILRVGLPC